MVLNILSVVSFQASGVIGMLRFRKCSSSLHRLYGLLTSASNGSLALVSIGRQQIDHWKGWKDQNPSIALVSWRLSRIEVRGKPFRYPGQRQV